MVSSMRGNAISDGEVLDGKHVASKVGDVGDNDRMTCGEEVSWGGVEYLGGMKVSRGGVEYSSGMEVSSVERSASRPPPLP